MEKLICTIPKSRSEEIRVGISKFTANDTRHDMFFARVFFDGTDGFKPAKNGLNLKLVHLPALIKALQNAEQEARIAGLIEDIKPTSQSDTEASMIISINKDWRLRSDSVQWILDHRVESNKGTRKAKTVWKLAGFSRHLNCIILELARQEIRLIKDENEYPADTLALLIETLDRIEVDCHQAIREAINGARTSTDAPEVKMT